MGFMRSRELLDNLHHLVRNTNINLLDGNKVIEVRAAGIDKGTAAARLLESMPAEFVLAIGDDKTDEDIFNVLKGKAVTVKVGFGISAAGFNVRSQRDAIRFLDGLTKS